MNIFQRSHYKFTDKKISPASVMGIVLPTISLIAMIAQVIISFHLAGNVAMKSGITSLMCLLFSLVGLGLAVSTYFKKNVFYIFAHVGVFISSINLLFLMYIYGLGIMAN